MAVVLVVDDEHGIAEILEAMIEEEGHRVLTAGDGVAGLKAMTRDPPDLVFTDTMMPGTDGPAMVRAMAADPRLSKLPVVAMSAMPEETVGSGYPRYSAFLKKPFRMVQVSRLLHRFLGPK